MDWISSSHRTTQVVMEKNYSTQFISMLHTGKAQEMNRSSALGNEKVDQDLRKTTTRR